MKNLKLDMRAIVFWISVIFAAILYRGTLAQLLHLANTEELYSYLPLVPVVALYTLWYKSNLAPPSAGTPSWGIVGSPVVSIVFVIAAIGVVVFSFVVAPANSEVQLTLATLSLLLWIATLAAAIFGNDALVKYGFSVIYLVFMIPLPQSWVDGIVAGLQKFSADGLAALLSWSGVSFFREEQTFAMPELTITVAPECSGIDSTYALLMTAVLASFLFLKSNALRLLVVLFVGPLSIARNALRIYTIVMATLHWNPNAIDGPIHRQGGKPFFVLALIPLFLIIYLLKRLEKRRKNET